MKIIYAGLESSGKSLRLASKSRELVERNATWLKKSGIARPLWSNLKFSTEFEKWALDKGIKINYWENLDDLIKVENADVIIDEVGNYFDSRMWADLSLDVRKWLTQAAKCGIEIYGSAQDFAQVDKSFRRLTNAVYEIKKVCGSRRPSPTKPPIKRIWGVCFAWSINPASYREDDKEYEEGFLPADFFFIRRKHCEIFDTTQKIGRSKYPAMRHEERRCQHHKELGGDGSCNFCKVIHI